VFTTFVEEAPCFEKRKMWYMLNIFAMNILSLKFAYLSDISKKFCKLNTNMQWNDTNITTVTEKAKAFTGKLGLWVRKLKGKV
jgi:hypothetical protein